MWSLETIIAQNAVKLPDEGHTRIKDREGQVRERLQGGVRIGGAARIGRPLSGAINLADPCPDCGHAAYCDCAPDPPPDDCECDNWAHPEDERG